MHLFRFCFLLASYLIVAAASAGTLENEFGPGSIGFETDENGSAQKSFERHQQTRAIGQSIDYSISLDEYSEQYSNTHGSDVGGFDFDSWSENNGDKEDDRNSGGSYRGTAGTPEDPLPHKDPQDVLLGLRIAPPTSNGEEIVEDERTYGPQYIQAGGFKIVVGPEMEIYDVGGPVPGDGDEITETERDPDASVPEVDFDDVVNSVKQTVGAVVDVIRTTGVGERFIDKVNAVVTPMAQATHTAVSNAVEDWKESHTGKAFMSGINEMGQPAGNAHLTGQTPEQIAERQFYRGVNEYLDSVNCIGCGNYSDPITVPFPTSYIEAALMTSGLPPEAYADLDINQNQTGRGANQIDRLNNAYMDPALANQASIYGPSAVGLSGPQGTDLPDRILSYGNTPTVNLGRGHSFIVEMPAQKMDEVLGIQDQVVGAVIPLNNAEDRSYLAPGGIAMVPSTLSNFGDEQRVSGAIEELHHAGVVAAMHYTDAANNVREDLNLTEAEEQALDAMASVINDVNSATSYYQNNQFQADLYVSHPMEQAAKTVAQTLDQHVEEIQSLNPGMSDREALLTAVEARAYGAKVNEVVDNFAEVFTDERFEEIRALNERS